MSTNPYIVNPSDVIFNKSDIFTSIYDEVLATIPYIKGESPCTEYYLKQFDLCIPKNFIYVTGGVTGCIIIYALYSIIKGKKTNYGVY